MKIAIMQPYFFPYAGYFRLFAAVDLFVILDCVQFPRRGWVHRNQLTDHQGQSQWLTLPLMKGDRDSTRICDLCFREDAKTSLLEQFQRFPTLIKLQNTHPALYQSVMHLECPPTQYLVDTLAYVTHFLGISRPLLRSSELEVSPALKGQDRIIEIAKQLGAKHYINAPGGRDIYDADAFSAAGLTLHFLSDHKGSFRSMLERLVQEDACDIAAEICNNALLDCVSLEAAK